METPLQQRVRERLEKLGLSSRDASRRAGLSDTFVRDILNGKSRNPTASNLQKLAIALDTSLDYFSALEHTVQPGPIPVSGLRVEGKIQAGAWLDTSLVDDDGEPEIIPMAHDARFPKARQYALAVIGDSMNLEYADGSYVACVDFPESGLSLKEDHIVHVERRNGPLVEITLKAVHFEGRDIILMPRSTNPKHLPIRLDGDEDTEIVVKGIVIGDFRRRSI